MVIIMAEYGKDNSEKHYCKTNGRSFRSTCPPVVPPGCGLMIHRRRHEEAPPEAEALDVVAKPKASKNIGHRKNYG